MEFRKHTLRNQTNRNLIVIAIGFLATVLAGTFVFQLYIGTSFSHQERLLYVTVDNQTDISPFVYSILYNDSLYTDTLTENVASFRLSAADSKLSVLHFTALDTINKTDTVAIHDSTAYIVYQIKREHNNHITVKSSKTE